MQVGMNEGAFGYIGFPSKPAVGGAQTTKAAASGVGSSEDTNQTRALKRTECQTCKNRKYQDGSNENVSFKAAAHISPEAAAGRVRAHESEHVANAYDKAFEEGGKVVQASVSIHMAVCPECGRTYVSGGLTRTKIMTPVDEANPYNKSQKELFGEATTGNNADYQV
ncbi:MAG: hypothetical protein K6G04_03715 [Lachnospiraceae bacterium]|nr:hypothetical protein [Lachnospiraceae bacterium]